MREIDYWKTTESFAGFFERKQQNERNVVNSDNILMDSRRAPSLQRSFDRSVIWHIEVPVGGGMQARLVELYIPGTVKKFGYGIKKGFISVYNSLVP